VKKKQQTRLFNFASKRNKAKKLLFRFALKRNEKSEAKLSNAKNFWKQNKAKIQCINFALVGSKKF
jgi:hypothetical protein